MGDFNAHFATSSETIHFYHDKTNLNGQLCKDFAQETDLLITNTHYKKRKGKLWTFMSDCTGNKTQVDYIMIRTKWRNSSINCEAYNSFSSIGSDHRILNSNIKLSFRSQKKKNSIPMYNWSVLKNKNRATEYSDIVTKRYNQLNISNEDEIKDISLTYGNFILANQEACKSLLPKKRKLDKNPSRHPDIAIPRDNVNEAYTKYVLSNTEEKYEMFQETKRKLQEAYDKIESDDLEKTVYDIENSNKLRQHAKCWQLINDITGRKTTKKGIIKASNN